MWKTIRYGGELNPPLLFVIESVWRGSSEPANSPSGRLSVLA
jgi:hypothetical protein